MRIDAYNAVNQVSQTSAQVKKVDAEKRVQKDDKLEISQAGKDINVAKKAIKASPDVREDKIEAIKKQMAEGTYSVSTEALADKILNSFMGGF